MAKKDRMQLPMQKKRSADIASKGKRNKRTSVISKPYPNPFSNTGGVVSSSEEHAHMEDFSSDDDVNDIEYGSLGDDSEKDEDDDREKYLRVLQGITGMPTDAFDGSRKNRNTVISEPYAESEFNPSRDILESDNHVTIDDMLDTLKGKSGYIQLVKRAQEINKKAETLSAPLPKVVQDKVERKVAYEESKKNITKWDPIVKRNREAPTIIFDRDTQLGYSTVGAIASEFVPRTDFERKMAAVVSDDKIMEAHKEDGGKLLELNKVSVEEFKKQRNQIAKMRSLLFNHEVKMKRIKKIKSKTFRRISKKDKAKLGSTQLLDEEASKEQAMKQEFKRAEERLTLRHKNRSKWAKHILERGLNAQDDETRAAMAAQLSEHARLTRKMKSMRDSSSGDSSDDDVEGEPSGSDTEIASKLLTKAKEKTLQLMEEDGDAPKTGVLSLPFMVRGLKRKEEAAIEEAKLAVEEYDESLNHLGMANDERVAPVKGRRVFGATANPEPRQKKKKTKTDICDSENDSQFESEDDTVSDPIKSHALQEQKSEEDFNASHGSMFKAFDDVIGAGTKKTYEVSIFTSGTWRKMADDNSGGKRVDASQQPSEIATGNRQIEDVKEMNDSDSEGEIVDGDLPSFPKETYKLPSQEDLVREAFAGDDVEDEFARDKEEILNDENPEPEKPVMLPGWGQWTKIQKKKGLPSWMIEEHESAKRRRNEALQKRKDAHLKHVIISEKLDKKTEKLHTKSLPYPFTSQEVFEQSMRMPIGPEFNPVSAVGVLNRPEVLKRAGVIIKPVKFEEIDPHEKSGETKSKPKVHRKSRGKVLKSSSTNSMKPVISKS